jgi:hypothetical protein
MGEDKRADGPTESEIAEAEDLANAIQRAEAKEEAKLPHLASAFAARKEAYNTALEATANAWKEGVGTLSGDDFHAATMALHDRNDIAPLMAYLRSDRPLSSGDREGLARLLELLHARSLPLKGGRPGGTLSKWPKPDYVAAFLVDQFKDAWRQERRKRNVPSETEDEFVDAVIAYMQVNTGKRLNKERILRILHGPKKRRL